MKPPSEPDTHPLVTAPPAPFVPGRCSVQTIGADPASPLMTIYRSRSVTAVDWIARAARANRFNAYLLRRDPNRWELYNAHGEEVVGGGPPATARAQESTTAVPVDRDLFLDEARAFIGDPDLTLLTCAEGHAGASAADHANFKVVCRRMIEEAPPADLEQIYLFDSRKWPCQVTGVFANIAMLSPAMQDVYLDRLKWIQNSWPLVQQDFRETMLEKAYVERGKEIVWVENLNPSEDDEP